MSDTIYKFKIFFNNVAGAGWCLVSEPYGYVLCVGGEILPTNNTERSNRPLGTLGGYYFLTREDAEAELARHEGKAIWTNI